MAHEQFFYSRDIDGDRIILEDSEHLHLSRVMRKKPGDEIWISDGVGTSYHTRIGHIEKDRTRCEIIKSYIELGEPANKVSLAVGIIKPAHWEIMLEKAVELGVYNIFPLLTQHTVIKSFKRERSEKIILSALKQCGRSHLPVIHEPVQFDDFIPIKRNEMTYICDNQDDYPLLESGMDTADYLVLIGPEGGFSQEEVELAMKYCAKPVLLTNRRLRTETACLSALSRLVV